MNKKSTKTSRNSLWHADVDQVQDACASVVLGKPKKTIGKHAGVTVRFGSTSIVINEQKNLNEKRNIKAGQSGLARALKKIIDPGVKIDVVRGVPLFHADPIHPGKIIRELNGKRESGVLVNGQFKVGE